MRVSDLFFPQIRCLSSYTQIFLWKIHLRPPISLLISLQSFPLQFRLVVGCRSNSWRSCSVENIKPLKKKLWKYSKCKKKYCTRINLWNCQLIFVNKCLPCTVNYTAHSFILLPQHYFTLPSNIFDRHNWVLMDYFLSAKISL